MASNKRTYDQPHKVFQVVQTGRKQFAVRECNLMSRNGSWYTFRSFSGDTWTENGMRWHETIFAALDAAVCNAAFRLKLDCLKDGHETDIALIRWAVRHAGEWGQLLGNACGTAQTHKR